VVVVEEGGEQPELSPETSFLAGIGSESDDAPTPSECCWQQVWRPPALHHDQNRAHDEQQRRGIPVSREPARINIHSVITWDRGGRCLR
jgi:hypothetical protein